MKRIRTLLVTMLILVCIVSTLSVGAMASTSDVWFYEYRGAGTLYTTDGAKKEDDTPVYCYPTQSPDGYVYALVGGSDYKSTGFNAVTVGGNYVGLRAGNRYVIHSYVHETGYTYAKLRMYVNSAGYMSGWWSADTTRANIPSYISAN